MYFCNIVRIQYNCLHVVEIYILLVVCKKAHKCQIFILIYLVLQWTAILLVHCGQLISTAVYFMQGSAHNFNCIINVNVFHAVLGVGSGNETPVELPKKLIISPPSASRIQLPDGRHLAYEEQGVSADRARFSLIAPHSFLSSRLAGSVEYLSVASFSEQYWYFQHCII